MLSRLFRGKQGRYSDRVEVRNGGAAPITVIFEPWADEYPLAPEASLFLEAESPLPGRLTVEHQSDAILVWAWDSCVARVRDVEGVVVGELMNCVPHFPSQKS